MSRKWFFGTPCEYFSPYRGSAMTGLRPHMLVNEQGSDDNFSDDESSPLTENIYGGSTRTVQETKGWDVFRDLPPKQDSGSMESQVCLEFTVKILKVIAYLVTFIIVLCCGVIAKGSLFFMTSQLRPDRVVPYCNKDLGRDKQFVVNLPLEERVAWTWCLFIAFIVPELGTLFRSMRMCLFKSWRRPPFSDFVFVTIMESAHTVGVAMLVFIILPELDVIKGAMLTNCVCFVPAILSLMSRTTKGCTSRSEKSEVFMKALVDIAAIVAQATAFVMWPLLDGSQRPNLWLIPISLFCVSCGWWENYVTKNSIFGNVFIKPFWRIKDRMKRTRYFTYMFISVWKIFLFFSCTCTAVVYRGESVSKFFTLFSAGFSQHKIRITEIKPMYGGTTLPDLSDVVPTGEVIDIDAQHDTAMYILIIHIIAAYLCYIFGKFACKIVIQGFSYAFPVNLTIPVTISLLIAVCGLRHEDLCFFHNSIPDYLFFESPPVYFLNDFITKEHAWIWLLWLLSQTWITLHIWTPKLERLAATEKLFVRPMYDSLLIDQSLGMNRRRDDGANDVKTEELADREKDPDEYYETISVHTDNSSTTPRTVKKSDSITRIFACVTMWHETREEMMEMLKSILRLDEDQCARRVAQKYLRIVDPDYYEFETHIFFDDAFEISDVNDDWAQVNRFVKLLVSTIDEAATHVHETNIRIRPPTKYPTPYGGRLVWTLPGKTKMIAHLKDKSKIRHRKRWSQVMYMYYLLGHRLMELPISVERKEVIAENTYLLTLDGDIDFQPHAVRLLIDLMKKNRNLGAACGRIHPVGSGLMVWYQMFEYAIGHWLQKATEHMIGCVLCSPGCFSLFRGKALMDDNVMRRYTTRSDQARHYVQYDQGEDRWLCTLLLQRGYRVEYSAASDAYTHCPEGFNEFFNQRRRWVPSTMANIMDLLMDYKRTIKINDNISLPYIWYQIMLMGGTILGPGTIFLMLVGAFVAAFRIDNWTSFYYNIVPILFFMFVCFTCKANIQLLVAQILSTAYALIMMAVFVGTALQLGEDGAGSPSAIFLSCMIGSFLIAAILHPQEFKCILPILIYFLSIPSMYLLLILYSIINLNVVAWGTREVQTKKTKKLRVALVLGSGYGLIMVIVLVATLIEMHHLPWQTPSTMFIAMLLGEIFITAVLHPREFICFFFILIYYPAIPCMYVFLIIFAIFNLNDITWGTREQKKPDKELEQEKKDAEEAKRKAKKKTLLGFLQNSNFANNDDNDEGSFELSFAGLFKCMFCTYPKPIDEKQQLLRIAESLDDLGKRLETIERVMDPQGHVTGRRRTTSSSSHHNNHLGALPEDPAEEDQHDDEDTDTASTEPKMERNDDINPFWIEDRELKKGPVAFMSSAELLFWKDLLDKYLFPIDEDKAEKARIAGDLIELRNSSVFGFFMINALFVMIVFLLQLNKESLHIKWPFGVKTNITYDETTQEARVAADLIELRNKSVFAFFMMNALFVLIVFLLQLNKDQIHVVWPFGVKTNITYVEETAEVLISKEYLQLEPIGLVFVFFFALILVIQFTAMLFHRFGTISHILASTELNWCCNRKVEEMSQDKLLDKQAVDIVRHLQKLKGINGDYDNDSGSSADRVGRRRTIYNIEKQRHKTRTIGTLDVAFRKRFLQMKMDTEGDEAAGTPVLGRKLTMRREVREALEVRRRSLQAERRKSQMQTLGANNAVARTQRVSSAGVSVKDLFEGHPNPAYEPGDDDGNSLRLQSVARNWAELERANGHV